MYCLDGLKQMCDETIYLVVTPPPPYDDIRKYKGYSFDFEEIVYTYCQKYDIIYV